MKKRIKIVAVAGIILLITLTFVSRSVYNRELPQVTAYEVDMAYVPMTIETVASLYYEDETIIKSDGDWKISDVLVKDGDEVKQGDILLRFDTRASDIEKMRLDLNILQLTNALKMLYGSSRTETAASLDIAKAQLELFLTQMPPADGLKAPCDGVVFGLSVKPGETIPEESELLALLPDTTPQLKFELPPKDGETFGPGAVVNALFETVISDDSEKDTFVRRTVTGRVSHGILNGGQWECIAALNPFEGRAVAGQEVPLKVEQQGTIQENVVPTDCIFDTKNNKKAVYAISTRSGLFGNENYLTLIPVEVLYDNRGFASVSGDGLYQGITLAGDPSRFVENGTVVWVRD